MAIIIILLLFPAEAQPSMAGTKPPWKTFSHATNGPKAIDPDYLPKGFLLGDPAKMTKEEVFALWDFWCARQKGNKYPLRFQQLTRKDAGSQVSSFRPQTALVSEEEEEEEEEGDGDGEVEDAAPTRQLRSKTAAAGTASRGKMVLKEKAPSEGKMMSKGKTASRGKATSKGKAVAGPISATSTPLGKRTRSTEDDAEAPEPPPKMPRPTPKLKVPGDEERLQILKEVCSRPVYQQLVLKLRQSALVSNLLCYHSAYKF